MSGPRPTKDRWLEARERWESNPTETFESISKWVGVSRVAVSKRADKEGWKRPTNLRQIVEKAHLQADAKVTPKLSLVTAETAKRTEQTAVDVRADVLEVHRSEWARHRELFTLEDIQEDFDNGRKAKISAEMLLLRQKGERAAYGLDAIELGDAGSGRELSDVERAAKLAAILARAQAAKAAAKGPDGA